MKSNAQKILPEDYILSVLSPEQRLDAALKLGTVAFQKTKLSIKDIEKVVSKIRKKLYEKK
ncbi:MAG: hypothetical protein ABII74_00985 [Elusimicrobiota bacterium]